MANQRLSELELKAKEMCDNILRIKNSNIDACGYKIQFFTNDLQDLAPLTCQNCRGLFHKPTILPCNHWFCRSCISKANKCPIDDSRFNGSESYTLENLQKNIQSQPVICVNNNKGCNWRGELRGIYQHYAACRFSKVQCKHNCGKVLQLKEMLHHENSECQLRPLKCAFCTKSILARDMYNHDTNSCKNFGGETFWRVKVEDGNLEVSESSRVNLSNYTMKYYPRKKVVISDSPPQVSTDSVSTENSRNSRRTSTIRNELPNTNTPVCTTDTVKTVECKPSVFTYCESFEYCNDSSSECSSVGPVARTLTNAELKLTRKKSEKLPEIHSEDSGFFSSHDDKSPNLPEAKLRKNRKFFKAPKFSFLNKNSKSSWNKKKDIFAPEKTRCDDNLSNTSTNGSMEWKIKDISSLLKKDRTSIHYSPPFYTNPKGYKACIRAHFGNGKASFYLCLQRGENDKRLKWPYKGQCTIKLANIALGNEIQSKSQVKGDTPGAKMPKKSNNLCSLCYFMCDEETLEREGVIEDDCLTVFGEMKDKTALVHTQSTRKEEKCYAQPEIVCT